MVELALMHGEKEKKENYAKVALYFSQLPIKF